MDWAGADVVFGEINVERAQSFAAALGLVRRGSAQTVEQAAERLRLSREHREFASYSALLFRQSRLELLTLAQVAQECQR